MNLLVHLPIRTRNPLNQPTGNTRVAGILKTRERATQRGATLTIVRARVAPYGGVAMLPVRVTLTRLSSGTLDAWDALGPALKPLIDGIADAFGLRDDDERLTWKLAQRKAKRGVYGVECLIESNARQNNERD